MADIVSNLRLDYRLRDGSGTVAHDSAGNYNGTLVNGPAWGSTGVTFTAGSSQYISTGQTINTITGTTEGTVAIWLTLSGTGTQTLFGHLTDGAPEFGLQFLSGTCYAGWFDGSEYRATAATSNFGTGSPILITVTYKVGVPTKLYSGNSLVGTAGTNTDNLFESQNFTINGKMWSGSAYSSNTTHWVRVWGRALAAADVTQLFNDGYVPPAAKYRRTRIGVGIGV